MHLDTQFDMGNGAKLESPHIPAPSVSPLVRLSKNRAKPEVEGQKDAVGHSLRLHFEVDEHPFATYFDVHQGCRVLIHSHISHSFAGYVYLVESEFSCS